MAQFGSRDGAVVRALASHQCGSRSILGPDAICEFVVGPLLSSRGFSPGTPVFPSPKKKTQHFQIPIRSGYFSGRIATMCGGAT